MMHPTRAGIGLVRLGESGFVASQYHSGKIVRLEPDVWRRFAFCGFLLRVFQPHSN
jgi:hypothetical protein